MEKFNFSPQDLSLNRQGILSKAQIGKLRNNVLFSRMKNIKLWLFAIVFFIVIILIKDVPLLEALPGLILMILFYAGIHFIQIQWRIHKLVNGKIHVEQIEGVVEAFLDEKAKKFASTTSVSAISMSYATARMANIEETKFHYCIKIENNRFYVGESTFNFFEKGKVYIIYYIQALNIAQIFANPGIMEGAIIVSAEKIDEINKWDSISKR